MGILLVLFVVKNVLKSLRIELILAKCPVHSRFSVNRKPSVLLFFRVVIYKEEREKKMGRVWFYTWTWGQIPTLPLVTMGDIIKCLDLDLFLLLLRYSILSL